MIKSIEVNEFNYHLTSVIDNSNEILPTKFPNSSNDLQNIDVLDIYAPTLREDLKSVLDFDYTVKYYEENPVIIEYTDAIGKFQKYTPHYLIHYKNKTDSRFFFKPTLIQVMHRKELWEKWKRVKPMFKAGIAYAESRGWNFKILTEVEIRNDYLYNAKFLSGYKRAKIDRDKMQHLLHLMNRLEITTPEEIMVASSISPIHQGYYLYTLWFLVANGFICSDLTRKLAMTSEIWVKEGFMNNNF